MSETARSHDTTRNPAGAEQTAGASTQTQTTTAQPSTRTGEARRESVTAPAGLTVALTTEQGTTRIAESVVAKIAGLAARDIPGVYSMGTGMARRVGQLRSLIPGGSETTTAMQGVSVEVGEREAAIDLDIVTWYGQSIVDISDAVRRNVAGQVEGMTGLRVIEVNINVGDIHVEAEGGAQQDQPQRVQ